MRVRYLDIPKHWFEAYRSSVVFANAGITAGPGFLNVDGERGRKMRLLDTPMLAEQR